MTYTAKERKIIHSQLVGAKKYLWDGKGKNDKDRYICLAVITHVLRTNSKHGWSITKQMIEKRLVGGESFGGTVDVGAWLHNVAKIPLEQLTDEAVQTYRREWLDHLIKEFSK